MPGTKQKRSGSLRKRWLPVPAATTAAPTAEPASTRMIWQTSCKMIDADVIVLASPVYFYSISAQLKAVIDRTVARWLEVKDKEFYYITTMADEEKASADTTLACFRGYADCVEGAAEKGVLVAGGVYEPGAVCGTPAMAQAYEMGRNV